MHPILTQPHRLRLYLLAWLPVAVFLALLLVELHDFDLAQASLLAVPVSLLSAFMCLSAWYPCRALPATEHAPWRLAATHIASALIVALTWVACGAGWDRLIVELGLRSTATAAWLDSVSLLTGLGVLLYLFSVIVHYHVAAVEAVAEQQRDLIQLDSLARQAELKTLRAQVNPHFLFNSLNSISALTASDPEAARRMCLQLADFFRSSIALGKEQTISLEQEARLLAGYLAIEKERFGERLRSELEIADEVAEFRLPPLLLQPLVENAVVHGISQLIDGGELHLRAWLEGDEVRIRLRNSFDAEAVRAPGEGVGLANVRERVRVFFGESADLTAEHGDTDYLVELRLPRDADSVQTSPT